MKKFILLIICIFIKTYVCTDIASAYNLTYENFNFSNINKNEQIMVIDILNLTQKGYVQEAIKISDKGIQQNPNRSTFYLSRAYTNMRINNYDSAISDLNMSIKLDANFSILAYYLRAYCYYVQKKYKSAMVDLDKAISLLPTVPYIKENYNQYYYNKNSYAINSNYEIVHYLLYCLVINVNYAYIKDEIYKKRKNINYKLNYKDLKYSYENIKKFHCFPPNSNLLLPDISYQDYKYKQLGSEIEEYELLDRAKSY